MGQLTFWENFTSLDEELYEECNLSSKVKNSNNTEINLNEVNNFKFQQKENIIEDTNYNAKVEYDEILMNIFDEEYKKLQQSATSKDIKRFMPSSKNYNKLKSILYSIWISDLSFDKLKEIIAEASNLPVSISVREYVPIRLYTNILIAAAKTPYYCNEDKNSILECEEALRLYTNGRINHKMDKYLDKLSTPYSFVILPNEQNTIKTNINGTKKLLTVYIKNCNKFVNNLIVDCAKSSINKINEKHVAPFIKIMDIIFNNSAKTHFNSYSDFDDNTFKIHFDSVIKHIEENNYNKHLNYRTKELFINLYTFIEKQLNKQDYDNNFKKYDLVAFRYLHFVSRLEEGYDVYNYSVYEEPPIVDKFMLKPQNMALHENAQDTNVLALDFSQVINPHVRKIIKEMFWYDTDHEIKTRYKIYLNIFRMANQFMTGEYGEISNNHIEITHDMVLDIILEMQDYSASQITRKTSLIKYFFKYLDNNNYSTIAPSIYQMISMRTYEQNSYKDYYDKEELKKLIHCYKENYLNESDDRKRHQSYMYYLAIRMFANETMRISTVLNIKVDSLKKTLNSRDKNKIEYVLQVSSKTSKEGKEDINITENTKKIFDLALEATKEYRKKLNSTDQNYLFIYESRMHNIIKSLTKRGFERYHKEICEKYNIEYKPFGAIRNTRMNAISEVEYAKGNDDKYIEKISGHTLSVHNKNYATVNIREFCQDFYEVEIGDITLKGKIGDKTNEIQERKVDQGAGYCSESECNVSSNLKCILCSNFVTTVSCISEVENIIQDIDEKMKKEKIQHEREFLFTIKQVYVKYLERLYERKEELANG